MKTHTTNYINTFIEIAEDSPVVASEVPPLQVEKKTIARLQYEMVVDHPYKYTSDDVIFATYAAKNDLTEEEFEEARNIYFSKGQACLRASALTKRYGWGIHHDAEGRIAMYPVESEEYKSFVNNAEVKKVKAMRSKRG